MQPRTGPTVRSLNQPASSFAVGPLPNPLMHPAALPMVPGSADLVPTAATRFLGSDGRFEIYVPAGAVWPDDITLAGGQLSLLVKQVGPASGGTGGGSGRYSFGSYLVQTVDALHHEWMTPLRKALTFKLHISPEEYALDLRHPFLVFNADYPIDTNFNPDPTGSVVLAGQANLSPPQTMDAAFDASAGALVATTVMPADPVAAFNTDAPVATFGKPDLFSADLNAGALSGSIPIDLPPGPAGLTPPLALTYSSAGVNEQHNPQGAAGWVGEGWTLSLGSISWAEHNVAEAAGTNNWENSWQLSDAFGTSVELIPGPPDYTQTRTFCGLSQNYAPTPPPLIWRTSPESHIKIVEVSNSAGGTRTCAGTQRLLPCFRAYLLNGIMEEFGCTAYSMQWYPLAGSGNYGVNQWNLDLIQDAKGNQIRVTYYDDTNTPPTYYPRDIAMATIEWGSPGCTGSDCALKRVRFDQGSTVKHVIGTPCSGGGSPRCDDPQDLSGSGGMVAPLVQNTYVLNDIFVEVRNNASAGWNTLRDYRLSYEQAPPQPPIHDPATGQLESVAGHLTLMGVTEIGFDGSQLPARTFTYQPITNYYEDDAQPAANPAYCPGWVPNGRLCSQSYGGNSYYLSTASNGLGLTQTFGWSLARNNTYVGQTNPFYCNTSPAPTNCTLADNQNWSRVVLSSETDTTAGSSLTSTTTYGYTLSSFFAQACPQCKVGYTWGNQKDGDFSDYYNAKFMGFSQVTVTHPDLAVETHYYHSSLGWGVYNCIPTDSNAVACGAGTANCFNPCTPDAWWMTATVNGRSTTNAFHGREQEADYYDKRANSTDPLVLLRKTTTSYAFSNGATVKIAGVDVTTCRPSNASPSNPSNQSLYGNWDSQQVSELDPSNPVMLCDPQTATVVTQTFDGGNASSPPSSTKTYLYDLYGRVTYQRDQTTNGVTGTATDIYHKPQYNQTVDFCNTDGSSCTYLVDFPTFNDTEDLGGTQQSCTATAYDTQNRGEVIQVDRYADCMNRAGLIRTQYAYDQYGNQTGVLDPNGVAAVGGGSTYSYCAPAGGMLTNATRCTGYDGAFHALPVSSAQATSTTNGLTTSTSYGAGFGMWPDYTTDPNGNGTFYHYDGLGRVIGLYPPNNPPPPGRPPPPPTTGTLPASTTTYSDWCGGTAAQRPCVEVDQNQRPGSEAGGTYVPVTATRICDTRAGSGTACAGHTVAANRTLNVQVTGQGGIPSTGVAAAVLNVAVTNTGGPGYVVAYPTGSAQPAASNLNFVGGRTVANLVQLPVGANGQVTLLVGGSSADVIVDVQGYVAQVASGTAGLMRPLMPSARICDTRSGTSNPCTGQTLAGGTSLDVQVAGQGGIPSSGVQAVVINVVATTTAAAGSLTVYPTGGAQPSTSNLNWSAGQTIGNRVVVPIGLGGKVTVANVSTGSTNVIVDAFAWTTDGTGSASGSEYAGLIASRICDTRAGTGTQCAGQTLQASTTMLVQVAGQAGVPSLPSASQSTLSANQPTAVEINVSVVGPSYPGALTIYPSGQTTSSTTADLNFGAGQTVANLDMVVPLGSDGKLALQNLSAGAVDVIIDVEGYYTQGASGMAISRAFYDGWGRLVETRSLGPSDQDVVRFMTYDASGRLVFQSIPYFVPAYEGPPSYSAYSVPDLSRQGTSNTYDGLDRLTSTTDALSNTTTNTISVACNVAGTSVGTANGQTDPTCYEQTLTIDPNGHQQGDLVDGFGRKAYVQRFTGNSSGTYAVYATTAHQYDLNGQLTKIFHPDGHTSTSYTYDTAGRTTKLTDPDSGTTNYSYDPNGNLTQSADARTNQAGVVNTTYDSANRPLTRSTPGTNPATTFATFTYDGGMNGVGHLTNETFKGGSNYSLSGSYDYSYDVRGQLTSSTLKIGGQPYALQNMQYNDAGNLTSETYPTNEVVGYSYNNAGWLAAVGTSQGGTSLLNNAGYAQSAGQFGGAAMLMTSAALGGGAYQYSATYDALLRGTDLKWTSGSGSTTFFDQQRTFDGAGNVTSATTTLPGGTDNQVFCYDEQDRLIWAGAQGTPSCSTTPIQPGTLTAAQYQDSRTYDTMGRITTHGPNLPANGGPDNYQYGTAPAPVHGVGSIVYYPRGSTVFRYSAAYDAAGNMICRDPAGASCANGATNGAQLSYNAAGRLTAWQNAPTNPTAVVSFLYDAQGNRVEQQATQNGTTTTTVYVGNREEVATTGSATTTTTYYYAGSMRIALAVNGSFSYLASDGLGSADVAIKAADSSSSAVLYAPYGGVRYSSGTMPTDYGFTGQHADAATGLDYYNARYYDPAAGQFTSADSILPGSGFDILGLSRYAYVEGNPESRGDPTGHAVAPQWFYSNPNLPVQAFRPEVIQGGLGAGAATDAGLGLAATAPEDAGVIGAIAACAASVVCAVVVVGGVVIIGGLVILAINTKPQPGYWTANSCRCPAGVARFHPTPQWPGERPKRITPDIQPTEVVTDYWELELELRMRTAEFGPPFGSGRLPPGPTGRFMGIMLVLGILATFVATRFGGVDPHEANQYTSLPMPDTPPLPTPNATPLPTPDLDPTARLQKNLD